MVVLVVCVAALLSFIFPETEAVGRNPWSLLSGRSLEYSSPHELGPGVGAKSCLHVNPGESGGLQKRIHGTWRSTFGQYERGLYLDAW